MRWLPYCYRAVVVCLAIYVLANISVALTAYRIAFQSLVWHPRVKSKGDSLMFDGAVVCERPSR